MSKYPLRRVQKTGVEIVLQYLPPYSFKNKAKVQTIQSHDFKTRPAEVQIFEIYVLESIPEAMYLVAVQSNKGTCLLYVGGILELEK